MDDTGDWQTLRAQAAAAKPATLYWNGTSTPVRTPEGGYGDAFLRRECVQQTPGFEPNDYLPR